MFRKDLLFVIVDRKGWVQYHRAVLLKRKIKKYRIIILTPRLFAFLFRLGIAKNKASFFSTWRTAYQLTKDNPGLFKEREAHKKSTTRHWRILQAFQIRMAQRLWHTDFMCKL